MLTEFIRISAQPRISAHLNPTPLPTLPPPPRRGWISTNRWSFFRVCYRNLALLHLRVLFLACIVLLQNKHTTLVENGENLINALPRISAHSQGPNILISA